MGRAIPASNVYGSVRSTTPTNTASPTTTPTTSSKIDSNRDSLFKPIGTLFSLYFPFNSLQASSNTSSLPPRGKITLQITLLIFYRENCSS